MIYPAKYNGINFSYDFTRVSDKIDFEAQRNLTVIPSYEFTRFLSFFVDSLSTPDINILTIFQGNNKYERSPSISITTDTGIVYFYQIPSSIVGLCHASLKIDSDIIYSEYFRCENQSYLNENSIKKVIAYNNDNKHGYLIYQAFGFFKIDQLGEDIFINEKIEYKYSYSRSKIISSENQIAKRFRFLNLNMYQSNLLKWLCNCENLEIDGVSYQLISDFTELEKDENSEKLGLMADFVEVNQSFFSKPSTTIAKNIFNSKFFIK